jgi:hypothetical protein
VVRLISASTIFSANENTIGAAIARKNAVKLKWEITRGQQIGHSELRQNCPTLVDGSATEHLTPKWSKWGFFLIIPSGKQELAFYQTSTYLGCILRMSHQFHTVSAAE